MTVKVNKWWIIIHYFISTKVNYILEGFISAAMFKEKIYNVYGLRILSRKLVDYTKNWLLGKKPTSN